MRDMLKVKGQVKLVLKDKYGNIKAKKEGNNLIVASGRDGIADQLLASPSIAIPSHMALGTGTANPTLNDTALENEIGSRVSLGVNRTLNQIVYTGVFGPGVSTGAITEAGIFNSSSGGTMYSRITFDVINKGSEDSLEVTWTWTIGA